MYASEAAGLLMQEMLEQEFEKSIDAAGAGATWTSPGWLTQLNQLWGGKSVRSLALLLLCFKSAGQAKSTTVTTGLARECVRAPQDAPVADAKPDDIQDLLGGALFKALYKWMEESGPIYLLPTGPVSSFLVISDPEAAKHVLMKSDNPKDNIYGKGLVAEVSEFLFGIGFATSGVKPSYTITPTPESCLVNTCTRNISCTSVCLPGC